MQVHLLLQIKQGNAARHPVDLMGLQLCKLRLLLLQLAQIPEAFTFTFT